MGSQDVERGLQGRKRRQLTRVELLSEGRIGRRRTYQTIRKHGVQVRGLVNPIVHDEIRSHWTNCILTRLRVAPEAWKAARLTFARGKSLPLLNDEKRGRFRVRYGELDTGESPMVVIP